MSDIISSFDKIGMGITFCMPFANDIGTVRNKPKQTFFIFKNQNRDTGIKIIVLLKNCTVVETVKVIKVPNPDFDRSNYRFTWYKDFESNK